MAPIIGTIQKGSDPTSKVPDIGRLQLLQKSAARWTRLLTKVRRRVRKPHNFEFQTQESRPRGVQTTINHGGGYNSGDTVWRVTNSRVFSVGDQLINGRTGHTVQIESIDYVNHDLSIEHLTNAASVNNGDYISRVANTAAEGYTVGPGYMVETSRITNYVQTVTTPIEWTDMEMEEWSYLSEDQRQARMDIDRERMAIEHIKDVNRALLLSRKHTGVDSDGNTIYFCNGLWYSITSREYDHSGGSAITETQFLRNVVEPVFLNAGDSTEKWALCSRKALTEIAGFGRDKLRFLQKESQTLGFNVTAYSDGSGEINLVHEPNFDEHNFWSEAMVVTDLNYIQLALKKDTEHRTELQNRKDSVSLEEWRTRVSLDMAFEECMIRVRDLRTAA